MLGVADVYDAALHMPAYLSLAATLTALLLLVLYVSQRRDVQRLHAWMESEPGHPEGDLSASEALLDRAEADLEEVLGTAPPAEAVGEGAPAPQPTLVKPPAPTPAPPPTPVPHPSSPITRVTRERPALERITTERAALLPHPRWRRLVGRMGQPRVLGLVGLLAIVLGLAAIFGSERLLREDGDTGPGRKPGAVVPGQVTVAVLNGTTVPGLAGKVGDDIEVNGFKLGTVSNSRTRFDQTVVMYSPKQRRAAKRVAHDLGVKPVQPIDRQTERATDDSDVVVIAGADRAQP